MRQTKNLDQEITRFADFTVEVLNPILASLTSDRTSPDPTYGITVTAVYEKYGFSNSRAFQMMFRRLANGNCEGTIRVIRDSAGKVTGFSRNGLYSPTWKPNEIALLGYKEWRKSTTEFTGRSLVKFLEDFGANELVWIPDLEDWFNEEDVQILIDYLKDSGTTSFDVLETAFKDKKALVLRYKEKK
jgi:hypothetical protein